jgi:hypothetical protein
MGQLIYDPGSRNQRPWNAGRKPGAKRTPAYNKLEVSCVVEAQVFLPSQAPCRSPGVVDPPA